MKKLILLFLSVPFLFAFIPKDGTKLYADNTVKCAYSIKNGLLDGKYVSYYKNGVKKSQGNFTCNNRTGEWDVWDSTGKLKCKRYYENNLSFKQIFPVPYTLPLPQKKDEVYQYNKLKEKDIVWEKRVWRNLQANRNELLFTGNFPKNLKEQILNSSIFLYDENFNTPFSIDVVTKKINAGSQLVGIKIKEDAFFDASRQTMETRIIGFCPVFKNSNDTLASGWIYYPQIRSLLSKTPIELKENPALKNADDLFYFRYFTSQIEKEINIYDRSLSGYCKNEAELIKERERIEIQLIESEHDNWLLLSE